MYERKIRYFFILCQFSVRFTPYISIHYIQNEHDIDVYLSDKQLLVANKPKLLHIIFKSEVLPLIDRFCFKEALAGVNMTNVIGNTTNCISFDPNGFCLVSWSKPLLRFTSR